MKKVAMLALLMSLGVFAIGCEQKKTTPPAATPATDAAPPATDAAAPATDAAPPAEK